MNFGRKTAIFVCASQLTTSAPLRHAGVFIARWRSAAAPHDTRHKEVNNVALTSRWCSGASRFRHSKFLCLLVAVLGARTRRFMRCSTRPSRRGVGVPATAVCVCRRQLLSVTRTFSTNLTKTNYSSSKLRSCLHVGQVTTTLAAARLLVIMVASR